MPFGSSARNQVEWQIPGRAALARRIAGDSIVGGVRRVEEPRVLAQGDHEVPGADRLELCRQGLHIEGFHLLQLSGISGQEMHEDAVFRLLEPVRVVVPRGWGGAAWAARATGRIIPATSRLRNRNVTFIMSSHMEMSPGCAGTPGAACLPYGLRKQTITHSGPSLNRAHPECRERNGSGDRRAAQAGLHTPRTRPAPKDIPYGDPEQVRKLADWGLTQNDIASFVGWCPQPSGVGPVPHQPGFLIVLRP